MKFNVKTDDLHKVKTELLVIPLPPLKHADNKFLELDKLCNHFLSKIARENQIDGNIEQASFCIPIENVLARSILLVGVSKNGDCDLSEFKKTIKPCIDQVGKLKRNQWQFKFFKINQNKMSLQKSVSLFLKNSKR